MDDSMTAPNGRVTNSDLDRRVGDLENSVDSIAARLGGVETSLAVQESELRHVRELVTSGFSALTAKLDVQSVKLDSIAADHADPSRTPAGKAIHSRLSVLEGRDEEHRNLISQASGAQLAVRVIAGVLLGLLTGAGAIFGILSAVGAV